MIYLKLVNYIANLIRNNEYKHQQFAVGIKVSQRMFGRERRYPVMNHFL